MRILRCRYTLISALVIVAAHLFAGTVTAIAIPLTQYERDLKHAITALDSLNEVEEDAGPNDLHTRVVFITESIKGSLRQNETVEAGADVYTVDNSWLHTALDELAKTPDEKIPEKLAPITATLHALEERVAERQNPGASGDSKEQAKAKLESILARPEYATSAGSSSAIARLLQRFARWLQKFFPKRRTVDPGRIDTITFIAEVVVIGIAALLLLYVLQMLLRAIGKRPRRVKTRKKREPRIVLGERLEPDATASDLLSEAETLARQGDLRAAIRKAYIALLVELGDRKVISLAHHKTNRDYLNSLRGIPQLHSRMRGLTESFERHWYGFVNASPNDWQDFRTSYHAALKSEMN
jgi:uncharacterized protein DUF4129